MAMIGIIALFNPLDNTYVAVFSSQTGMIPASLSRHHKFEQIKMILDAANKKLELDYLNFVDENDKLFWLEHYRDLLTSWGFNLIGKEPMESVGYTFLKFFRRISRYSTYRYLGEYPNILNNPNDLERFDVVFENFIQEHIVLDLSRKPLRKFQLTYTLCCYNFVSLNKAYKLKWKDLIEEEFITIKNIDIPILARTHEIAHKLHELCDYPNTNRTIFTSNNWHQFFLQFNSLMLYFGIGIRIDGTSIGLTKLCALYWLQKKGLNHEIIDLTSRLVSIPTTLLFNELIFEEHLLINREKNFSMKMMDLQVSEYFR